MSTNVQGEVATSPEALPESAISPLPELHPPERPVDWLMPPERIDWWESTVAARLPLFRNEEAAEHYRSTCSRMALDAQPHPGLTPSTDLLMESAAYAAGAELDHQISLNAAIPGQDEWLDMAVLADTLKLVASAQRTLIASRRSTKTQDLDREVERQMRAKLPDILQFVVASVRSMITDRELADAVLRDMYDRITDQHGAPV